jgi:hypothetical protein
MDFWDQRHGSSGRASALQAQSLEFKSYSHQICFFKNGFSFVSNSK